MEGKKKCYFEGCYQEAEYLCECSAMVYSCKLHLSNHLDSSDENHNFKTTFMRTKNALIQLLVEERSRKDKLKHNAMNLFFEHIRISESIFEGYLEKWKSDSENITKWIHLIDGIKNISKTETNPILTLLSLHPKEAIDKAKLLIPATSESYDLSTLFRLSADNEPTDIGIIKDKFENFLKTFEKIEKSLGEHDKYVESIMKLTAAKLEEAKESILELINKIEKSKSFLSISDELLIINPHKDIKIQYSRPPLYYSEKSGDSTTVLEGELKSNRTDVAIKIYKNKDYTKVQKHEKEAKFMQKLHGKSSMFLDYYGMYKEIALEGNETLYILYLVMELGDCNLMDDIKYRNIKNQHYEEYKDIVRNLLEGFTILESFQIYHRNISPENILLSKTKKVKIAGLGSLKLLENPEYECKYNKISGYIAPELKKVINALSISIDNSPRVNYLIEKAGVYALGWVFLELFMLQRCENINEANQNDLNNYFDKISPAWIWNMLKGMLKIDPENRLTFKNAIQCLPDYDYRTEVI